MSDKNESKGGKNNPVPAVPAGLKELTGEAQPAAPAITPAPTPAAPKPILPARHDNGTRAAETVQAKVNMATVPAVATAATVSLTETVAVPGKPAGLRRFKVSLKDNPTQVIEHTDGYLAQRKYMEQNGIIRTVHQVQVQELPAEEAAGAVA